MLIHKAFSKPAPVLWLTSLGMGLLGLLRADWGTALVGMVFGLGFIAARFSLTSGPQS